MVKLIAAILLLLQDQPTTAPATNPSADVSATLIVVQGAQGEAEFGQEFSKWAQRFSDLSQQHPFIRQTQIGSGGTGLDDREQLQNLLRNEAKEGATPLWIVLIGHGTNDGREAKFNLRGPDVTDLELAEWLKPFSRPIVMVDCSSSSSTFINRLSGKGRVILTATRSASEANFARFGDYFSASINDSAADLDKDGQTSLLEAFLAASARTQEFYKQNGRLMTEHALLDDNGDKLGIGADFFKGLRATRSARSGAPLDGARAHQVHLIPSTQEQVLTPEQRKKRDELELALESLRSRKSSMEEGKYLAELETILVELAHIYAPADK